MSTISNTETTSTNYYKKDPQTQEQKDKNTAIYIESLTSIAKYFGVSELCALYLFHRSFRSRRKDDQYLEWNVQLQNALVKVDKCLNVDWDNIYFGYEDTALKQHGIIINEMPETVLRWPTENKVVDKNKANNASINNGWVTVSKKKRNKKHTYNIGLIRRPGLFI